MTMILSIAGMTCENCARHVRDALAELPGVRSVEVDLERAEATLDSNAEVPREMLAAALDDAGYTLR
jgi:copper chaperone CopZ